MNKRWYDNYGISFKYHLREHYCFKCGTRLDVGEHRRIVKYNSPEAKYFFFRTLVGDCEFIHKAFYCARCREWIEFETQLGQEDVDIVIKKTLSHFRKRKRTIQITKYYELKNGEVAERSLKLEQVKNICLFIREGNTDIVYRIPIKRDKYYERHYYCTVKKRKLIRFIEDPRSRLDVTKKKLDPLD